jgi:hypothetical protein
MFKIVRNAICQFRTGGLLFDKVVSHGNGIADFAIDERGRLWSWGRNYNGETGQGNYEYNSTLSGYDRFTIWTNYHITSPTLVPGFEEKRDWVKITIGEMASMGMDAEGKLWGAGYTARHSSDTEGNCALFGLPHDSGEAWQEWRGVGPVGNDQYYFFDFVRCAPGYTFKDFAQCYYYAVMIGQDNLAYFMGSDGYDHVSGYHWDDPDYEYYRETPTRVPTVTDELKFLAELCEMNYDNWGCVTMDNRILVVGYYSYVYNEGWVDPEGYVIDITYNLPDVEIVKVCLTWQGAIALLANGDVYVNGAQTYLGGTQGWGPFIAWEKYDELSNIVDIGMSQTGAWAIDASGDLFVWGALYYRSGIEGLNCSAGGTNVVPTLATNKRWKAVFHNYYQNVWNGIDQYGQLWAWGSQWWGPHLGIGTDWSADFNARAGITEAPVQESCSPQKCNYPDNYTLIGRDHRPKHAPVPRAYKR